MMNITVKEMNPQLFHVTVTSDRTTEHEVSVDPSYASRLCQNKLTTAELIEKSFAFLLDRESNTSILKHFDLSVISHYFPEYVSQICQ